MGFVPRTARLFVLAALLTVPVASADAQVADDWFASWQLNVQASSPSPFVRGRWKVSRAEDGTVTMIYDQVRARGGVTHMEWTGKFDGLDYRLQGPDAVVTYAYTPVNARTLNLVVKVDGRPTATAVVTLTGNSVVAVATNTTAAGPTKTTTTYERR